MPTDLFASDDLPFVDPNKDYLAELVGEGKKFSTPAELARGKAEADLHIARIEDEQKRLRTELSTRIKYEEFLDKLNSAPKSEPLKPTGEPPAKDISVLNPTEIEQLLEQKLRQRDAEKTAEQNLNIVDAKLREVLGPNYAQALNRQAIELGMSQQFVKNLAAANPKALFKLLGIDEKRKEDSFLSPPKSQSSFTPSSGNIKKGDSYYEEIRKRDPVLFFSAKVQNEMFNRIKEIGLDEFNQT